MKGSFPHYWSWNTKWSSACLSFANWASACEHQIGSQLCHFPDFQFGGTSWKHLWVKSISCWSLQVVSLHRQFMSVWYIRKTLKHGQFWKSKTWHLLMLFWDDSLPGWANGSSVGQTEPTRLYQEAFRDPGASYHEYMYFMLLVSKRLCVEFCQIPSYQWEAEFCAVYPSGFPSGFSRLW